MGASVEWAMAPGQHLRLDSHLGESHGARLVDSASAAMGASMSASVSASIGALRERLGERPRGHLGERLRKLLREHLRETVIVEEGVSVAIADAELNGVAAASTSSFACI